MEQAVVVGLSSASDKSNHTNESLEELKRLLETAGGSARETVVQKRPSRDPATLIGSGKAEEIGELVRRYILPLYQNAMDNLNQIAETGKGHLYYWNKPEDTKSVMTPDGYFKSGDIGIMNADGYTKIVDRKKDMILVSGFNVYPNELEEIVALMPGVLECAAIGVPNEDTGEAVKIFIVRSDPNLTEDDVAAYCKIEFTNYKRPKFIQFRDELPKTNVGKILRRELRGL